MILQIKDDPSGLTAVRQINSSPSD